MQNFNPQIGGNSNSGPLIKEEIMGQANLTAEQVEKLIDIIGEENVKRLLAGKITLEFKETAKGLFDKHGRRIPVNLRVDVCDADGSFRLDQPEMVNEVDYANRILRLHECLDVNTGITAEQLKAETERLLSLIRNTPQIVNILRGVWLPVVMPSLTDEDLGTTLEQYLEGVGKSYVKTFGDRKFYNYRKGELAGKVITALGGRHDQLVERMKRGPVVGIHFPDSLRGFSINAGRGQMESLPKEFILSGMDTVIAIAMYPDVLACGWGTPALDLAVLSWWSAGASLSFGARDAGLHFGSTADLVHASGGYSAGLLFLG